MIGHIYKITNLINEKVYIGQTVQSLKDRWYQHVGNSIWSSQYEKRMAIKQAIRKYGKENFRIELLEDCDRNLLNDREKYWINYYDSYNSGYNSTKGGQGGFKSFVTSKSDCLKIIDLYKAGFSLRELGKEFELDKTTIKSILIRHNIELRNKRNYKFTSEELQFILNNIKKGMSRKEACEKYKISKSYISQLIKGQRRI